MEELNELPMEHKVLALKKLEREQQALTEKLVELDSERQEYNLVLEAFEGMEGTRRCYRMVGDVLVERTVQEVRPVLKDQEKNVSAMCEKYKKEIKEREQQRAAIALSMPQRRQPVA